MWSLFATRRELKRLVRENKSLRDRAEALEKERSRLFDMLLATNGVWADRVLTAAGKYPMSAEVRQIVEDTPDNRAVEYDTALNEYLLAKKLELEDDAREAGIDMQRAVEEYKKQEPFLKESFRQDFGFNN